MPRTTPIDTPRYLDLANPDLTAGDVLDATERWCDATGASGSLRRKRRSILERTLAAATQREGVEMLVAPVAAVVRDLPGYATGIGSASAAGQYRSAMVDILEGVAGVTIHRVRRSVAALPNVSPELQPLVDAAKTKAGKNAIARMERVIRAAGHQPSDRMGRQELIDAGAKIDLMESVVLADMRAWRTARARLAVKDPSALQRYAPMAKLPSPRAAGLARITDLQELLEGAGFRGHHEDLTSLEVLRYLAPKQHAEVAYYAKHGRTMDKPNKPAKPITKAQREAAIETVCLYAALWCRYLDRDTLRTSGLDAYFDLSFPVKARLLAAETEHPHHGRNRETPTCPLIQHLFDLSLAERVQWSDFADAFDPEAYDEEDVQKMPHYLPVMRDELRMMWTIVREVFSSHATPDRMAHLKVRYVAALGTVEAHLAKATLELTGKDKLLAAATINYEQLVLIVIPGFLREVRAAKAAYEVAAAEVRRVGKSPERDRDARRARRVWRDASRRYMALAVPAADLKRDKQYTHGTLGTRGHFVPLWNPDGSLASLTCTWTRLDDDVCALKVRDASLEHPPTRVEALNPCIVDYEAATDWIKEHRVDILVEAKRYTSREAYDLAADMRAGKYALIPSPADWATNPTGGVSNLTYIMGRALYDGCVRFLGRDLPTWEGRRAAGYARIFSMHILRLFGASAIGGTYGLFAVASRLTDDTESTLRADYAVLAASLEAAQFGRPEWDRTAGLEELFFEVFAFDRDGRAKRKLTPIDTLAVLKAKDDADPGQWLPPAMRAILEADEPPKRRKRGTGAKGRARKAGPHKRTARPGQPAPARRAAA